MRRTTTTWTLLGHLAMQPWTTYELAAQMRRNVRFFYPRAESHVYAEAKRLVEAGLATACVERVGRRDRTVYTITDQGRAELRTWLASPPNSAPQLHFEGLLRVFFAPSGTTEDLRRALEAARASVAPIFETGRKVQVEYLSGRAPFQRYMLYRSFLHDFLVSLAVTVDAWATRSLARLDRWEVQTPEERLAEARAVFERTVEPRRDPEGGSAG